MNINISEVEKNTAVLLSSTTSFIMNAMSGLYDEIQRYDEALKKSIEENNNLKKEIDNLQSEIQRLEDSTKSEPSLSVK